MLINFKATEAFVERLDAYAKAKGMNRTQAIKSAVLEASMDPATRAAVPDRDELLRLLGESARSGSVTAMKALLDERRRDGDDSESAPARSVIDELAARRTA